MLSDHSKLADLSDLMGLRLLDAQIAGALAVVPIIGSSDSPPLDYPLLDDVLASGTARITEVSEGGQVPELLFLNKGAKPVLLLDGEELVGAKQNRILNLTILVPAYSEIRIPVSCVERGRWSWRSREFAGSDRALYAEARRSKMAQVSDSMQHGSWSSDQSALWEGIASKSARMEAHSTTGAASAMYEQSTDDFERMLNIVRPVPGQVGAGFLIRGSLVGVELFSSPAHLRRLLPKLVRSYGLDALDQGSKRSNRSQLSTSSDSLEEFMKSLMEMKPERHPAVGLGQDWRLRGQRALGAALVHDGRLVHLSAFVGRA